LDYYIIIPAHNEEEYISSTLNSVINQTVLPKKLVVVNDHSSDKTEKIIDRYISENKWIYKINKTSSGEHLPGSKVVEAFNEGLKTLDSNYSFIVKLDADLILPKNYFETITSIFKADPKIGIAGGFAFEKDLNGIWRLNHLMNKDHVRGAFKAYSKQCFDQIGGLKNSIGWDTVDELLAQFYNYTIYTDDHLHIKHLRPTGGSYNKKARYMQGEAMYKMRYGWSITLLATLKTAIKNRQISSFINSLKGYYYSKKKKTPYIVSMEQGVFIRKHRWNGILTKLKIK